MPPAFRLAASGPFGLPRSAWALLNLALLLTLAAVLAHWTWRLAAPETTRAAALAAPQAAGVETIRAAHLFGEPTVAGAAPAARATSLNLKLHGVFAAPGNRPAMAILNVDGEDRAVARGAEVQPGVVLGEVAADHVLLVNQGVTERLDLDRPQGQAAAGGPDAPRAMALTPAEIDRAIANPQQLGAQIRSNGDEGRPALIVDAVDAGGFAARLGLQSGDTLRLVNGNPVSSVQDLARLLADAASLQRVTLVGERQGKPLILSYRLQP